MNVTQLKRFCKRFPGATETLHGEPWNFLVYEIRGRKFAYFKTSQPERFIELTDRPGIKPARYRGRYGWVTIVTVAAFPDDYLRELVGWSYEHALTGGRAASRRRR